MLIQNFVMDYQICKKTTWKEPRLTSASACHTLPPVVFPSCRSWHPGSSLMCCTESDDSPWHLNSVNLSQQQPVFLLFVIDVIAHCHQQCASTHLANSASPISFNRLFSWGYDPFTHACKARPLTDVGWTSVSASLSLLRNMKPQKESG